ncbi:hypothetical protein EDB84DRAFT_1573013 [Lactarius hengduanensis]|nr:hypothetical protein EDB84DRAFT_1573013 [Lactarius hengduanensis]
MSNATNSGERMATRGDAKEKMSKVMAIVRSGGIEDSDLPEDGKTAKKAELEDTFMKKAVDARSSHPRRWTVDLEDSRAKTPDSESENDGVDETAEHNERHSDAGLYAQAATPRPRSVRPQAATPRPRPVHPQKGTGEESRSEDLDTAPQVKEKAASCQRVTVKRVTRECDSSRDEYSRLRVLVPETTREYESGFSIVRVLAVTGAPQSPLGPNDSASQVAAQRDTDSQVSSAVSRPSTTGPRKRRQKQPITYDDDNVTDSLAPEEENILRRSRRDWYSNCYQSFEKAQIQRDAIGKVVQTKAEDGQTYTNYVFKCKVCVFHSKTA